MTKDIFVEKIKNERDFQQLINATVSHEMRNPLNSIVNLTLDLQHKIKQLENILKDDDGQDSMVKLYMEDFLKELKINCQR